jgi:hypothetical protein
MNSFVMPQDVENALEQAAHDLVERRGEGAIEWLNERIRQLQASREMRALDMTYRILSLVESRLRADSSR